MSPKAQHWLFLVLWAAVVSIAVCVVLAWINIRAVNPLTYIMGIIFIIVPGLIVYLFQRKVKGKYNATKHS